MQLMPNDGEFVGLGRFFEYFVRDDGPVNVKTMAMYESKLFFMFEDSDEHATWIKRWLKKQKN
jgi:hypothetical protein